MAVKRSIKPASPVGNTFDEIVVQMLRCDHAFREAFIQETLQEQNPQQLILSLRQVIDALGGISVLAKETALNRKQLYRMLSQRGKPDFFTLTRILNYLGLHLSVERNEERFEFIKKTATCH